MPFPGAEVCLGQASGHTPQGETAVGLGCDVGPLIRYFCRISEGYMKLSTVFIGAMLVMASVGIQGCVHAPRDTTGFAQNHSLSVSANFDDTWQAVKDTLRDKELEIYTRDKRGKFVAYTPMKRRYLQPNRYQYSFDIEAISEDETRIALDTRKQSYGVTLLTYPGWHDRKTADTPQSQELLDAIQAKLDGAVSP